MERQQPLEDLQQRKDEITRQIAKLAEEFGPESPGCLQLEDVYSTRNGQKYGPYGPYYYRYYYVDGELRKEYLGKQAANLTAKQNALARIQRLEREYKDLLKEERRIFSPRG